MYKCPRCFHSESGVVMNMCDTCCEFKRDAEKKETADALDAYNKQIDLPFRGHKMATAIYYIRIQAIRLGAETGRTDIKDKIVEECDRLVSLVMEEYE